MSGANHNYYLFTVFIAHSFLNIFSPRVRCIRTLFISLSIPWAQRRAFYSSKCSLFHSSLIPALETQL